MYLEVNECVGCPPEMGCIGEACPQRHVVRCYCDKCKDELPDNEEVIVINNEQYCPECAEEKANDFWDDLTLDEKLTTIGWC